MLVTLKGGRWNLGPEWRRGDFLQERLQVTKPPEHVFAAWLQVGARWLRWAQMRRKLRGERRGGQGASHAGWHSPEPFRSVEGYWNHARKRRAVSNVVKIGHFGNDLVLLCVLNHFPVFWVILKNNNKLFPPRGTRRNCVTVLGYDLLHYLIGIRSRFYFNSEIQRFSEKCDGKYMFLNHRGFSIGVPFS